MATSDGFTLSLGAGRGCYERRNVPLRHAVRLLHTAIRSHSISGCKILFLLLQVRRKSPAEVQKLQKIQERPSDISVFTVSLGTKRHPNMKDQELHDDAEVDNFAPCQSHTVS